MAEHTCGWCGTAYVPNKHTVNRQRFCSTRCRDKARWQDPARKASHLAIVQRRASRRNGGSDLSGDDIIQLRKARHCAKCQQRLTRQPDQPNSKHIDHIVPDCMGGTWTAANVRVLCRTCNLSRPHDGSDLIGTQVALWSFEPTVFQDAMAKRAAQRTEIRARKNDTAHRSREWQRKRNAFSERTIRSLVDRIVGRLDWDTIAIRQGWSCGATAYEMVHRHFRRALQEHGPPRPERTGRPRQATELRATGLPWKTIAQRLGYKDGRTAYEAARRHRTRQTPQGGSKTTTDHAT